MQVLDRLVIPEGAASGLVLTADASGVATWQAAPGTPVVPSVSRATATAAISTTEVQAIALALPANVLKVGTTVRLRAAGVMTVGVTAGTMTARVRIGPSPGSLSDPSPVLHTVVPVASRTAIPFLVEFNVTCRSAGVGGTIIGAGTLDGSAVSTTGTTGGVTTPVAVNTTVANVIQLTLVGSTGHSHVVHVATADLVVA